MNKTIYSLILLSLFAGLFVFLQSCQEPNPPEAIIIVQDEDGQPVEGAMVVVKAAPSDSSHTVVYLLSGPKLVADTSWTDDSGQVSYEFKYQAIYKVEVTKTITNAQDGSYNLIPGDLALVTVTINFKEGNDDQKTGYAVIEDHLPSGLIPVNFRMLNEYDQEVSYSDNYYYTEYLTDGVIIPFYLRDNKNTFTYKARVINEGTFSNPPVFFSMMYRPDIWGRSDFSSINIGKDRIISSTQDYPRIRGILWIFLIITISSVGISIFTKHVLKKRQANKI